MKVRYFFQENNPLVCVCVCGGGGVSVCVYYVLLVETTELYPGPHTCDGTYSRVGSPGKIRSIKYLKNLKLLFFSWTASLFSSIVRQILLVMSHNMSLNMKIGLFFSHT